ncbi:MULTISPECIES: hypothetical protein [unclassified Microcoleus]|uniref:hypothetical protein n=1 Tax=unclassified Microcoleus TaxID=2642155 RepID=UPI002FD54E98
MMWIEGMPCSKIQKILNVSATFISQCKMKFIENGVEELKLKYQGSNAYLSQAQRREIINYLDPQVYLSLQEFREYIEDKYDARFKSNLLYINYLMKQRLAGMKLNKITKKSLIGRNKKDRNRENFGRKTRQDRSWKTCLVYD